MIYEIRSNIVKLARISETLNQQTRAAVRRKFGMQPYLNSSELLTIPCSCKNFMKVSQAVQELRWQTNRHTHPQTDWTENNTLPLLRYRCDGKGTR